MLDLELGEYRDELRLYNPNTSQRLQTPLERAETRAQQETIARQNTESDLAKALAEIERLRAKSDN